MVSFSFQISDALLNKANGYIESRKIDSQERSDWTKEITNSANWYVKSGSVSESDKEKQIAHIGKEKIHMSGFKKTDLYYVPYQDRVPNQTDFHSRHHKEKDYGFVKFKYIKAYLHLDVSLCHFSKNDKIKSMEISENEKGLFVSKIIFNATQNTK